MIECFLTKLYLEDKMEWIIIDDGTDKIGDLIENHPNVKYFKYDTRLPFVAKKYHA